MIYMHFDSNHQRARFGRAALIARLAIKRPATILGQGLMVSDC